MANNNSEWVPHVDREMAIVFKYKLHNNNTYAPLRATANSAGFDLFAPKTLRLLPGEDTLFNLDISIEMPSGFFGLLTSRSSMELKGIVTSLGIIDSDFTGQYKAHVKNYSNDEVIIKAGERFCQLIFISLLPVKMIADNSNPSLQVGALTKLEVPNTIRTGGWGSTGVGKYEEKHECLWCKGTLFTNIEPLYGSNAAIKHANGYYHKTCFIENLGKFEYNKQ